MGTCFECSKREITISDFVLICMCLNSSKVEYLFMSYLAMDIPS